MASIINQCKNIAWNWSVLTLFLNCIHLIASSRVHPTHRARLSRDINKYSYLIYSLGYWKTNIFHRTYFDIIIHSSITNCKGIFVITIALLMSIFGHVVHELFCCYFLHFVWVDLSWVDFFSLSASHIWDKWLWDRWKQIPLTQIWGRFEALQCIALTSAPSVLFSIPLSSHMTS